MTEKNSSIKISPSILAADFAKLGLDIDSVSNADYIHFDVMDGVFVNNISFGLPVLESVRKVTDKILDVHLMLQTPSKYIDRFIAAGGDIITFHIETQESNEDTIGLIEKIHNQKRKAGLSLKPHTPVQAILPFIESIDLVLVMSVEPGHGGQEFQTSVLPKISELRSAIDRSGSCCELEVDGGINKHTAKLCIEAGANVLVAGQDVFTAKDRNEHIMELRNG